MVEKQNTRLLVLETLLEMEKEKIYGKDALHKTLFQNQFLSKQDRAFVSRMTEGVTEYKVQLDYIINCFSKTKINKCKPLIRCVLRMGVYQMLYMDRVPNEVACDECVKLTKKKGFQNLAGFVNGVLRNIARNITNISYPDKNTQPNAYLSVAYSMPEWLVAKFLSWYGIEKTTKMLETSLKPADLTIRVNYQKVSKSAFVSRLMEYDITVEEGNYTEDALHLTNINYVNRIPGFKEGEFFIQDESSMLLYALAGVKKNSAVKILDICAAPGGKCTHFAQKLGHLATIDARDLTIEKVSLIDENISRLGLSNIETKVWDARIPDTSKKEWADIVIADLPCSGLGIIAKKNDIKYHLTPDQLDALVELQREILTNAASYVRPGGILLYSTCTINPSENIENVKWFLEQFDFDKEPIYDFLPKELQDSMPDSNMVQLLPGVHKCDGFFIAKFRKRG